MKSLKSTLIGGALTCLALNSYCQLVITEIHYNPITGDIVNEYIEVKNVSAGTIDLNGYSLEQTGQPTFTVSSSVEVPSGGHIIFAPGSGDNADAKYSGLTGSSTNTRVIGIGSNRVIDGGTIAVKNNSSSTLDEVTFLTSWGANGNNKSLSLLVSATDASSNDNSSNWSESHFTEGTPGGVNDAVSFIGADFNCSLAESTSSYDLIIDYGDATISLANTYNFDALDIKSGTTLNLQDKDVNLNGVHLNLASNITNDGILTIDDNCTIIQTGTTNGGTGTYVVKQTGESTTDILNAWGTPVSGSVLLNTFIDANPCDIFGYSGMNQSWKHDYTENSSNSCMGNSVMFTTANILDPNEATNDGIFDIGRGYLAPGNVTNSTREFSGSNLNNGTYDIPVYITGIGASGNNDWNMIANPYPSGIIASQFLTTNSSLIQPAIYLWDPSGTGGDVTDYKVWTSNGSVVTTGTIEGDPDLSDDYIPVAQGFFVEAKASGNVTFNNSMRTNNNLLFYKQENTNFNPRYWLKLESDSYKNQLLVGFADDAAITMPDNHDATFIDANNRKGLYSIKNNTDRLIAEFQPPVEDYQTREFEIGFQTPKAGLYKIAIDKEMYTSPNIEVYLYDKVKQKEVSLAHDNAYHFYSTGEVQDDRFELIFKSSGPNTIADTQSETSLFSVRPHNNDILISGNTPIAKVLVTDVSGRIILHSESVDNNSIDITVPKNALYIIQVFDQNNVREVHKFVHN